MTQKPTSSLEFALFSFFFFILRLTPWFSIARIPKHLWGDFLCCNQYTFETISRGFSFVTTQYALKDFPGVTSHTLWRGVFTNFACTLGTRERELCQKMLFRLFPVCAFTRHTTVLPRLAIYRRLNKGRTPKIGIPPVNFLRHLIRRQGGFPWYDP